MALNLFKKFLLLRNAKNTFPRHYSNKIKELTEKFKRFDVDKVQKYDITEDLPVKPMGFYNVAKPWIEIKEIKRHARKRRKIFHMEMSSFHLLQFFTGIRSWPITPEELQLWSIRRKEETDILHQEYIPERVTLLRSDLAAAHFIFHRGGAIRFYGDPRWVGHDREVTSLPNYYVPGLYVEYIDATNTGLRYEGLMNILKLRRLRWLCLSGLEKLDNFSLDLLSGEYGDQLSYLDISHCRGINHNGLSCMYRLEKLKTLDVTGISDDPEFKMACSMLEDLNPKLEIVGVDYSIPQNKYKIETTQKLFK